jgi:hypothetical protein
MKPSAAPKDVDFTLNKRLLTLANEAPRLLTFAVWDVKHTWD